VGRGLGCGAPALFGLPESTKIKVNNLSTIMILIWGEAAFEVSVLELLSKAEHVLHETLSIPYFP
jgi:hypothetical protein